MKKRLYAYNANKTLEHTTDSIVEMSKLFGVAPVLVFKSLRENSNFLKDYYLSVLSPEEIKDSDFCTIYYAYDSKGIQQTKAFSKNSLIQSFPAKTSYIWIKDLVKGFSRNPQDYYLSSTYFTPDELLSKVFYVYEKPYNQVFYKQSGKKVVEDLYKNNSDFHVEMTPKPKNTVEDKPTEGGLSFSENAKPTYLYSRYLKLVDKTKTRTHMAQKLEILPNQISNSITNKSIFKYDYFFSDKSPSNLRASDIPTRYFVYTHNNVLINIFLTRGRAVEFLEKTLASTGYSGNPENIYTKDTVENLYKARKNTKGHVLISTSEFKNNELLKYFKPKFVLYELDHERVYQAKCEGHTLDVIGNKVGVSRESARLYGKNLEKINKSPKLPKRVLINTHLGEEIPRITV